MPFGARVRLVDGLVCAATCGFSQLPRYGIWNACSSPDTLYTVFESRAKL